MLFLELKDEMSAVRKVYSRIEKVHSGSSVAPILKIHLVLDISWNSLSQLYFKRAELLCVFFFLMHHLSVFLWTGGFERSPL